MRAHDLPVLPGPAARGLGPSVLYYVPETREGRVRTEELLELKLLEELRGLGAPTDRVERQVKCGTGRIDIVVYTQPPCLIEVKVILDERTMKDAIGKLTRYSSHFPAARLFVAYRVSRLDTPSVRRQLTQRNIRRWTPLIAQQVVEECRLLPPRGKQQRFRELPAEAPELEEFLKRVEKAPYRTARRGSAVNEAIHSLPSPDQKAAALALKRLGIMKAAILAPLLKQRPQDWKVVVESAQWQNRDELQRTVSKILKLKRRGRPDMANQRLYRFLLDAIPLDRRPEVAQAFEMAFQLTGSDDAIDAFLRIVEEAKKSLQDSIESTQT